MNRKIVQYASATARSDTDLVNLVNQGIKQGFEPFGGPIYVMSTLGGGSLFQALVRYEKLPEKPVETEPTYPLK